jgi:hypothetical protein
MKKLLFAAAIAAVAVGVWFGPQWYEDTSSPCSAMLMKTYRADMAKREKVTVMEYMMMQELAERLGPVRKILIGSTGCVARYWTGFEDSEPKSTFNAKP